MAFPFVGASTVDSSFRDAVLGYGRVRTVSCVTSTVPVIVLRSGNDLTVETKKKQSIHCTIARLKMYPPQSLNSSSPFLGSNLTNA